MGLLPSALVALGILLVYTIKISSLSTCRIDLDEKYLLPLIF